MRSKVSGRSAVIAVIISALFAIFAGSATASAMPATPAAPALTTPISGTFTDASGGAGTAVGTFTPTEFVADGSNLLTTGVAELTLTDSAGQQLGTESRTVTMPTSIAQASCQILDLVLGPLDLDLLGLVVHLDRVHLNITAEQGPRNLVGNLLCAIANLLNPGPVTDFAVVARLLNQIIALLNG